MKVKKVSNLKQGKQMLPRKVGERERERDRQTDRQTDRWTDRDSRKIPKQKIMNKFKAKMLNNE